MSLPLVIVGIRAQHTECAVDRQPPVAICNLKLARVNVLAKHDNGFLTALIVVTTEAENQLA